jgi:hypothetical protein
LFNDDTISGLDIGLFNGKHPFVSADIKSKVNFDVADGSKLNDNFATERLIFSLKTINKM